VVDALDSGPGLDVFIFNTRLDTDENIDTLHVYNVMEDDIWLDSEIFTALTPGALLSG
jgi:hypothetical protein